MRLLLLLALIPLLAMATATTAEPDPSFHLYLLIGQSNMAGRGQVDDESKQADPRVVMLTKALAWEPATDPLHFDKPTAGVGPGLAFAKAMAAAEPKARIGLIPCAVGGTSISAWVPGAEDKATRTHPYDDMLVRAKAALSAGVLHGIIWHQGEADRGHDPVYAEHLADLVARLRRDLSAPAVPFVAGELTVFKPETEAATTALNGVIESLAGTIPRYGWVPATGLADRGDKLHFDAASARELGRRYAAKMIEMQQAGR